MRSRSSRAAIAAGLVASAATLAACASEPDAPPRLVVLIAVDQLRPDRLDASLPGGLGRFLREGRAFVDAAVAHAHTETCPGHVTMVTGRHPGPSGVPGNTFVDPATGARVYCVDDEADDALVFGGTVRRSPRLIRATALGDWMKAARPDSKVYALSAKDRAAVPLGGHRPDGVYWLDWLESRGFTSSGYYTAELPDWLPTGRALEDFAELPRRWDHLPEAAERAARPDDYAGEVAEFGRTSGHPVVGDDWSESVQRLSFTPFLDDVTLALARTIVLEEDLGIDAAPDLLALSLSATDTVGHLYGPESHEAADALLRLDAALGEFLDFLDARVGPGRVLAVLTADHGVLSLPAWLEETGRGECPLPGGRADAVALFEELQAALDTALGARASPEQRWIHAAYSRLTVDRALAAERGVPVSRVAEIAKAWIEARPGVARVWTAEEMAAGAGPAPFAALYRNSFDPERSGDLAVQPARGCLISSRPAGTTHASPYAYDRRVPLVFFGPGVEPGRVEGAAATVDIAPTLAARLGVPAPADLDGRVLPLRER